MRSFVWKRRTDAHVLANLLLTLMCTITLKANMTEICSRPDRFRNLFLYCLVLAGTSLVLFGIRWGESGIFWYWLKFGIGRGQSCDVCYRLGQSGMVWYWLGPLWYCLVLDGASLVLIGIGWGQSGIVWYWLGPL